MNKTRPLTITWRDSHHRRDVEALAEAMVCNGAEKRRLIRAFAHTIAHNNGIDDLLDI